MNVLFLSRWFPFPPSNGSKLRIHNLLKALSLRHNVTLLSFRSKGDDNTVPNNPQVELRAAHTVEWREYRPWSVRALYGVLSPKPRSIVDTYSSEMAGLIKEFISKQDFHLVVASQTEMASYSDCFRGIPAIFEEVEAGTYYQNYSEAAGPLRRGRFGLTLFKHRRFVSKLLKDFVACTVVSETERRLLAGLAPHYKAIHVVPNFIDAQECDQVSSTRQQDVLIFAGSLTFAPNYEGVMWLLNEVLPAVRAAAPNVRVVISGDSAGRLPEALPGVVVTGLVPDVRPLVAGATISLAPIRRGGGTRVKILEAMALRTPVVSTFKAAEGLEVADGEHLLLADSGEDFANAVIRLLRSPALRRRLSESAYHLVKEKYDFPVVSKRFLDVVANAA